MHKIVCFIIMIFLAVAASSPFCRAEEAVDNAVFQGGKNEETGEGKVIVDLLPEEGETQEVTLEKQVSTIVEIGRYFETNYPGEAINGDLDDDVLRFFPHLKGQEVVDRAMFIRDAVKFYRYFREQYAKITASFLVPEEPPLILDESAYEKPSEDAYIDSPDLVVVHDFKKVVSYSSNPRDFKAYEERQRRMTEREGGTLSPGGQMVDLFSKLELKKLLFYGTLYEDPLTNGAGNGKWFNVGKNRGRLITENATVNGLEEIRGALHFSLAPGEVLEILGQNRPRINLSGANLVGFEVMLLAPHRIQAAGKTYAGLTGNFAIPVLLKLKDASQPLNVTAEADVSLCAAGTCRREIFKPELRLESGFGYLSTVDNFITQTYNALPKKDSKELEAESLSLYEEDGKPGLRLRLKTSLKPADIDVFVDDDAFVAGTPQMRANNDYVDVFLPIEQVDTAEALIGRHVLLLVTFGAYRSVWIDAEVGEMSEVGTAKAGVSLMMLLTAFVGGVLLNFMPCVFPVWCLEIFSVCRYGGMAPQRVCRSFACSAAGILAAAVFLILFLLFLRKTGIVLGWGMQFQNGWFLVLMLFAMILSATHLSGKWLIPAPVWLKAKIGDGGEFWQCCFTGAAALALALLSTMFLVETAGGFALAGTNLELAAILFVIALGLALPWFIVAMRPSLAVLLPMPGRWMDNLRYLALFCVGVTLFWLVMILYLQISGWAFLRLGLYAGVFLLLLAYRQKVAERLAVERMDKDVKLKIWRLLSGISIALCCLLLLASGWDTECDLKRAFSEEQYESEAFGFDSGEKFDAAAVNSLLDDGKSVLVSVEAPWCLTCIYNEYVVFRNPKLDELLKSKDVVRVRLNWANLDEALLNIMSSCGRFSVPFYVLFTPENKREDVVVFPRFLSPSKVRSVID